MRSFSSSMRPTAFGKPVGLVRTALTALVKAIDPQIEIMLITVAGTRMCTCAPRSRVSQVVKSVANIVGTSGANTMHRVIDDLFPRFVPDPLRIVRCLSYSPQKGSSRR